MDNDFPKMVYKAPGKYETGDGMVDYNIINSQAEYELAIGDGWSDNTAEAIAALQSQKALDLSGKTKSDGWAAPAKP